MNLSKPGYTYSACAPFTKKKKTTSNKTFQTTSNITDFLLVKATFLMMEHNFNNYFNCFIILEKVLVVPRKLDHGNLKVYERKTYYSYHY